MEGKYKNKYRVNTIRLPDWNYGWAGVYYITICTQNHAHSFGEIVDGKMNLSNIGVIADILWHEIKHHEENIILDAFVVMPNHLHGIIRLTNNDESEQEHRSNIQDRAIFLSKISPKKGSIGRIIGSYKSAVTKHAHRLGYEFAWQPSFYDHIIRENKSLHFIIDYINNNPERWIDDDLYSEK